MGLLDKPSIAEEVKEIRYKQLVAKEYKQKMKLLGFNPNGTEKRKKKFKNGKRVRNAFKRNVSKKSRQEWGARMSFFKSL